MHTTKSASRLALSTLLGVALAGTLSVVPAFADHMVSDDMKMSMPDPMSMSYPQAAPGGVHLYHWSDYTRTEIHSGSATDMRMDNEHKKMDHGGMMGMAMDDDDMMWDPAPLAYPQAAPGGTHLYHWKDYTQSEMEPGSVPDKRWEIRHKRDEKRREKMAGGRNGMSMDDDDMMWDPAPLSYPQAAPGGTHLYHWKDYTQSEMEPGSVPDKRWENDRKKDEKRHEKMEKGGMSK